MTQPRAVLEANARYLVEFVEAHNLCPFARGARLAGELSREVFPQTTREAAPVLAWIDSREEKISVALAIFPNLAIDPPAFHAFCAAVRAAHTSETFYVVAFHPDGALDASTPARLVPFLRRSPHPTLQFVRAKILDQVRGGHAGSVFAPSAQAAAALSRAVGVSESIAEANFQTVLQEGADTLAAEILRLRTVAAC